MQTPTISRKVFRKPERRTGQRFRFASSSLDRAVRDGPYKGNGEEGPGPPPPPAYQRYARVRAYIQMLRRVILARARTGTLHARRIAARI